MPCPPRDEAERLAVELYKAGVKLLEIERRTCLSRSRIYAALRKHGLKPNRLKRKILDPEVEEEVVREYHSGMKIAEIAAKHDISPMTIYTILYRHGVRPYRKGDGEKKRLTEDEIREMIRLRAEGLSIPEIAKRLRRSVSTVYMVLVKHCGSVYCKGDELQASKKVDDGRGG